MGHLLIDSPLLLLFIVSAIGFIVGRIQIGNTSLGVSAVLFVGLLFGSINSEYHVPDIIFQLGIVFFVYTIGLKSGPIFFDSISKKGWEEIFFIFTMLAISAIFTIIIHFIAGFDTATTVGIYTGSSTNTTALAGVIDMINLKYNGDSTSIKQLVVGYTFSYPMGVIGVMFALKLMERIYKIDYRQEEMSLKKKFPIDETLTSKAIRITNPEVDGMQIREIIKKYQWNIIFGRVDSQKHGTSLNNWDIALHLDDNVIVVGTEEELFQVQQVLGEEALNSLLYDRKEYDIVRIFVSNVDVMGKPLSSLNLNHKFNAVITRIRRGDVEMLATPDTILEPGDRIRFVASRKDIAGIQALFGDSYYANSTINLFSFGVGIALGLILGMIPFTLPGDVTFKLGFAGGPLIVGLVLGALRRTGPILWVLPYGSNVTLNQLGLTLLLAVIGISSGNTLLQSLQDGQWVKIFMAGSVLSILTTMVSVWIGYSLLKIPFSLLLGYQSNQPAILDFSNQLSQNRMPLIGYTFMFPISLILKIVFAQLIYVFLNA
ncbi:MAG: TrkA C-terminal domain-containing protein [Saprospiraceae bacterium]